MSTGRPALTVLPKVERLSDRVIRILGCNPGKFTLQGTNTYLVGKGQQRVLIDTGEGVPEWRHLLRKVLTDEKATLSAVVITHWHPDHVGGIDDALSLAPDAVVYEFAPAKDSYRRIIDGEKLKADGATLQMLHCPGHSTDHVALVLEEEDAMFTGDNVLGEGTSVFEDLPEYLASLALMKKKFGGRAYPGHGPVVANGPAKIEEYQRHRAQREEQIIQVLKSQSATHPEGSLPREIVEIIYADTPPSLHHAAERGVRQVLEKLEGEGIVTLNPSTGRYRLVAEDRSLGML